MVQKMRGDAGHPINCNGIDTALALAKGEKVNSSVYVPFELVTPANKADYLRKKLARISHSIKICCEERRVDAVLVLAGRAGTIVGIDGTWRCVPPSARRRGSVM